MTPARDAGRLQTPYHLDVPPTALPPDAPGGPVSTRLLHVQVRHDQDVVDARSRARTLAGLLGYSGQDQTRLATAVSELARNALRYAGGGRVAFSADLERRRLVIEVQDRGPGIPHLDDVLAGRFVPNTSMSGTGMGSGLTGTRRLMDDFHIETEAGHGTCVTLGKRLPPGTLTQPGDVAALAAALTKRGPVSAVQELQLQNQELLGALEDLARREEQLARLNRELEDTNRGVVALYSELEEKAAGLREAGRVKSMFLSYVSHEFRTPLHSVLGLSRLLLSGQDGALSGEQQRQVQLMSASAHELLGMVNDLLDLTKVDAGGGRVELEDVAVSQVLATLRALFQPLLTSAVRLVVDDAPEVTLRSDPGKLHQILRNFLSNALKFTEHGEVRVSAALCPDGQLEFSVQDSGVGIAVADQGRLFQEFSQVGQRRDVSALGTGLGLALTRRLAHLLGGQVGAESELNVGSRFWLRVPLEGPDPV